MKASELIKSARLKAGLTQEQVAKTVFVEKNTYSQYELGKRRIDAEMFFRISKALGMEVDVSYKEEIPENWEETVQAEDKEGALKRRVRAAVYEDEGLFDAEFFDFETEELLCVNSWHWLLSDSGRCQKDVEYFLKEKEEVFEIVEIQKMRFEDVRLELYPSRRKGASRVYAYSISAIRRTLQKMVFLKFGIKPKLHVWCEYASVDVRFDLKDEPTKEAYGLLRGLWFGEASEFNDFEYEVGETLLKAMFGSEVEKALFYIEGSENVIEVFIR